MSGSTHDRNQLFHLLSNHRRRYAIHVCKRRDRVTLSELATQVAAWEYGKDQGDVTSEERRRVYTSMQQTHLPALEEAELVTVEDKEVTLTDRAREVELYLEVVPADSIPWGQFYLGLSVVSAAVILATWAGIYPSWIPALWVAGLIVAAFMVTASVHVWRTRHNRLSVMEHPPERDVDG